MKNLCMYLVFWFSFAKKKKNVPKKIAFRSIQLKFLNVEKEIPYAISMHLFPHCVSCAY